MPPLSRWKNGNLKGLDSCKRLTCAYPFLSLQIFKLGALECLGQVFNAVRGLLVKMLFSTCLAVVCGKQPIEIPRSRMQCQMRLPRLQNMVLGFRGFLGIFQVSLVGKVFPQFHQWSLPLIAIIMHY